MGLDSVQVDNVREGAVQFLPGSKVVCGDCFIFVQQIIKSTYAYQRF
jgi:hypothetical protein